MFNLLRALTYVPNAHERDGAVTVPDEFCSPGYWSVVACYARSKEIPADEIEYADATMRGYAQAIGLPVALGGVDEYPHERRREGVNYSPLEHLATAESTDAATRRVNGCIRNLFRDAGHHRFVGDMCNVVSELHSNVWDHGMASGFSMAQRWPNTGIFEFALVDGGLGFLGEMRRAGHAIESDAEAIEWCMQKGASTKRPPRDDWAQRVPDDVIGAPFPPGQRRYAGDPHHAGLGLWKLRALVDVFGGQAWIASGRACVYLAPGVRRDREIRPWQGVAMACRFSESRIRNAPARPDDPRVSAVMKLLRRES